MRYLRRALPFLLFAATGACATLSPAQRQAADRREDRCAQMCARVLPEMTLSKDDGQGLCRCWAMGAPERVTPAAIASIRYQSEALLAGR